MDDDKPEPDRLHTFVVAAAAESDILIRVLGPFAVQEATIADIRLDRRAGGLVIAIEASGVSDARAELIGRRLEALAAVRSVGRGWRVAAP
ncbi:MAG: hypothetical protein GC145_04425 [Caulobacter sp.]|nr:hypothetical protein [Caulobacter sp.]